MVMVFLTLPSLDQTHKTRSTLRVLNNPKSKVGAGNEVSIDRSGMATQSLLELRVFVSFSVNSWIVFMATLEDTIHQITRKNTKGLNVFSASRRLCGLAVSSSLALERSVLYESSSNDHPCHVHSRLNYAGQ